MVNWHLYTKYFYVANLRVKYISLWLRVFTWKSYINYNLVGSHTLLNHATKQIINFICYKWIELKSRIYLVYIGPFSDYIVHYFHYSCFYHKVASKLYSQKKGLAISRTLIHTHKTSFTYLQHTLINPITKPKIYLHLT